MTHSFYADELSTVLLLGLRVGPNRVHRVAVPRQVDILLYRCVLAVGIDASTCFEKRRSGALGRADASLDRESAKAGDLKPRERAGGPRASADAAALRQRHRVPKRLCRWTESPPAPRCTAPPKSPTCLDERGLRAVLSRRAEPHRLQPRHPDFTALPARWRG